MEWHVGVWTSFLHSLKNITKCLLNFLPKFPSSLQFSKQIAVSEHRADFCKVPNCQYHLLIHDESIDLSSFNIDLNCDFSYQSVDCLFTTFKHHFPCIIEIQGFVFQKLLSAIDFHRSFICPVLTNLSFTKKRLLREKFRTKRNFGRQSEPSLSRSDPTVHLLLKISSFLKSEKRQEILQTISDLYSSLQ